MKTSHIVHDYFERESRRFDAIYDQDKPAGQRLVDRLFRRVILERFRLICNLAPVPGSWSVLDVGCGSGRFSVALALAGSSRVLGVDVAASMITIANEAAAAMHVAECCEFIVSSFLALERPEKFTNVVATGYYDYLEDPLPHLQKMAAMCSHKMFLSFPKRWEPRVLVRKARFALERGYVRFYSHAEVIGLMAEAGIPADRYSMIDLGRDWIVVVRVG
jgi:2-polyprenyl-3-methyl-5-hydroxy-6-metoxy-1,4-benzoquinol methylase